MLYCCSFSYALVFSINDQKSNAQTENGQKDKQRSTKH